jgi:hypothetical protein
MAGSNAPTRGHLFEQVSREERDRSLTSGLWARRAAVTLLFAIVVVALANVFGQLPTDSQASGAAGTMRLSLARTVRGGLMFQARVRVTARTTIDDPRLVLSRGWLEGIQVNSVTPEPGSESGDDGQRVVLSFGRLEAGHEMTVWIQLQANPTQPGTRTADITLRDGEQPIATIHRDLTTLP